MKKIEHISLSNGFKGIHIVQIWSECDGERERERENEKERERERERERKRERERGRERERVHHSSHIFT